MDSDAPTTKITAESVQAIVADLMAAEPDPADVVLTTREVVHAVAEGVVAMLERGFNLKQVRERLGTHGVVIAERSLRAYLRDAGVAPKGRRAPKRPARTARNKTTSSDRDRGAQAPPREAAGASAARGPQAPRREPAAAPPNDEFARADAFAIDPD